MGKRIRFPIAVTLLALVLAACGTRVDKEAYLAALRRQLQAGAQQGGGPAATGGPTRPGGPAATATTGGSATNTGKGGTGSTGGSSGSSGSDAEKLKLSTAVAGNVISIGMHIPLTGAAPLPTNFSDVVDAVEEYFNAEAKINGRTVRFIIEDDGYDPAKGAAACRKLAEANPLFVIGHTMPAVQDTCAGLFNSRRIPYLMRGTYEEVLKNRPLAFFGTISDDRQGRLLAQYVMNRLDGKNHKIAVVYQNDQTAAYGAFSSEVKARGGKIVVAEQSAPRQSDYAATVQKLRQAGADIVFLSMPPVDAIKISVQSQGDGYHPTWLSGATYWNYNLSVQSAGMALDGAIAFSPWPTIDSAAANSFTDMWRRYRPNSEPEDLGLIIWGWANLARNAMLAAGPQLSRATLFDALNRFSFNETYWQSVTYTESNHNGATSVAVFRADGQSKRWRQVSGFASSF
ncbi:MAG: ABC transporter substrate-binding protein [Actinomycetota bacterium]